MRKCRKNDVKLGVGKMKTKTFFCLFQMLAQFQSSCSAMKKLNKFSISNFVKFQLQIMSSKIERAFEKMTKFSIKIGAKKTLIRRLKGP